MTIEADGSGVRRVFDEFEREARVELQALAHRTGNSIRDAAKAAAPVSTPDAGFPGHYRDSIIARDVKNEQGASTIVFAAIPAGAFPNLDLVLEFGTSRQVARPHLWPAAHRHEAGFRADVESILQRIADAAGGR